MSTCYEFTFNCRIKPDVSPQVIETLQYMTRAEGDDTPFETTLRDDLFVYHYDKEEAMESDLDPDEDFISSSDWKHIISNDTVNGEEMLSGSFGSEFRNYHLKVRKFVGDDDFFNNFPQLIDWLLSISESIGVVGSYCELRNMTEGEPQLIYFVDGEILEKSADGQWQEFLTGL
jgi:hypothetical protein